MAGTSVYCGVLVSLGALALPPRSQEQRPWLGLAHTHVQPPHLVHVHGCDGPRVALQGEEAARVLQTEHLGQGRASCSGLHFSKPHRPGHPCHSSPRTAQPLSPTMIDPKLSPVLVAPVPRSQADPHPQCVVLAPSHKAPSSGLQGCDGFLVCAGYCVGQAAAHCVTAAVHRGSGGAALPWGRRAK